MFERGVDEDMIRRAIERGAKIKQTEGYLAIYGFVAIAYKKLSEDVYKIKTVMIHG